MNAPNWEALETRFNAAAAKLTAPNWHRRVSGVIRRVVKPDCHFCGRPDFIHHISCKRARSSWGNTRIAYGNAVIRAEQRLRARWALGVLLVQLKADVEKRGLVFVDGVWVKS